MKKHVADLESWEREWLDSAGPALDAARRASTGCPSFRVLSAAAAEALPPDEQRAVCQHVASCDTCRAFQEDLAALAPEALAPADVESGLAAIRRRATGDARAARRFGWRPALATAAVAVVAVVVAWRTSAPVSSPPATPAPPAAAIPTPAASPAPGPPSVEPARNRHEAAAPAAAASGTASGPALVQPDIKFTLAALAWRSPGSAGGELLSAMAPGVAAYRAKRFEEAERDFAAVRARFPSAVEVPFYLGVCQLFLGRNEAAVASLESAAALADETFAADVSWYLAIALDRAGRQADARQKFAALCGGASPYAARACVEARH